MSIRVPAQHSSPTTSSAGPENPRLFYFGTISRNARTEKPSSLGTSGSLRQMGSLSSIEDDANQPPIAGVKLGPLLGRGSFGSVHYGTWNGAQIAVKVFHFIRLDSFLRICARAEH